MVAFLSLQRNRLLLLGGNILLASRKSGNVDMVRALTLEGRLSRSFSFDSSSKLIGSEDREKPDLDLKSSMKYCMDQVKEHDYENYLWSTQLPVVCVLEQTCTESCI